VDCNISSKFVLLFLLSIMIPAGRIHADDMAEAIAKAEKAVLAGAAKAEKDLSRPVFHFRPSARWMRDICGAIFHKGYYHVFYQLNPYIDEWGSTGAGFCWGHARSRDLVTWELLPIALAPMTERGERRCNSGCVTLNGDGTPMIFYTFVPSRGNATRLGKREQWAAIACDDELKTWRRVKGNPLMAAGMNGVPDSVNAGWSDPFVFRAGNRTFVTFKACDGLVAEAENKELTKWKYSGRIDGVSGECPNFFKLQDKWVLLRSTSPPSYQVGMFDHKQMKFHFDQDKSGTLDYAYGPNRPHPWAQGLYGTNVLFDNKGRCVLFGFVSRFKPDMGWQGCMSLPRILSLGPDGHPVQMPAPALETLRGKHAQTGKLTLKNETKIIEGVGGDTLEVLARFVAGDAKKFGLRLRPGGGEEGVVELACDGKTLDVAGTKVPDVVDAEKRTMTLHLFFDKSAMELFINDGRKAVTRVAYPGSRDLRVELFSEDGSVTVTSVDAWEMGSIW